jgi:hypothetical protein
VAKISKASCFIFGKGRGFHALVLIIEKRDDGGRAGGFRRCKSETRLGGFTGPFFYGWLMLPVVMITLVATSPGQTFGVSVFNPYIRRVLNLSHSEISGAYTICWARFWRLCL